MPKHVQKCQPCCPCDSLSAPKNVVCQCDGASKSRIFSLLDPFWGVNDVSIIVWLKMFQGFSWGHSCSPNKDLWGSLTVRSTCTASSAKPRHWKITFQHIGVSTAEHLGIDLDPTEVPNRQGENCREPESANWQFRQEMSRVQVLKVGKSYPNWDVSLWMFMV